MSKMITAKGRVQGVGYRFSARNAAEKMNIRGTVKNKPDGSVEIIASGNEEDLLKYINWCNEGPIRAKVSQLIIIDLPYRHFEKFSII